MFNVAGQLYRQFYVFLSAETVTSLQAAPAVRIAPGNLDLISFIFLTCTPEPRSLTASQFESRWMIPSGQNFTFGEPDMPGFERFRVSQGGVPSSGGGTQIATLLFIQRVTYQDAGNYTCEVRAPAQSLWLSATPELQLEGN